MPYTIFKPGAVVIGDDIIVLGAFVNINNVNEKSHAVFVYNTKNDFLSESTPMPIPNVFFGCTAIENKIYIVSGTHGGHPDWKNFILSMKESIILSNHP